MRLYLTCLFLFILPGLSLAQKRTIFYKGDTINKVDKKGLMQGKWMRFYENDTIYYRGQFKDSKPVGVFHYYYQSGKLKTNNRYDVSGKTTHVLNYYENGVLMAKGKFVNQKRDSTWEYYNEKGTIKSREVFTNGIKNGLSTTFYSNGSKAEEVYWVNGKKQGPWKQYFSDGKIKFEGELKNGEPDGYVKMLHPNGNIWMIGKYKNGVKDSTWNVFREDKSGVLERQDIYKNGKLTNPQPEQDYIEIPAKEEDNDQ